MWFTGMHIKILCLQLSPCTNLLWDIKFLAWKTADRIEHQRPVRNKGRSANRDGFDTVCNRFRAIRVVTLIFNGGNRKAIAARDSNRLFVAPENGVLFTVLSEKAKSSTLYPRPSKILSQQEMATRPARAPW